MSLNFNETSLSKELNDISSKIPTTCPYPDESPTQNSSSVEYSPSKDRISEIIQEKPVFTIPKSSLDLMIPNTQVFRILAVYELIRKLSTYIRLTMFRIETFCSALSADENTNLVSHVMVCLLKTILKKNEASGIRYCSSAAKASMELSLYLMDDVTVYEFFREYHAALTSDASSQECHRILTSSSLPFMSMVDKLTLLEFLSRKCFESLENCSVDFISGEECKKCGRSCKNGKIIICTSCGSSHHESCFHVASWPKEAVVWLCVLCKSQSILGVHDSLLSRDVTHIRSLVPLPIGTDRTGREYYYMSRRVVAKSGIDIRYYSSTFQLKKLTACFESAYACEKSLIDLFSPTREIFKFLSITETLTEEGSRRTKKQSYFQNEIMSKSAKTISAVKINNKPISFSRPESMSESSQNVDKVMLRRSDGSKINVKVHKVTLPRLSSSHSVPTLIRDSSDESSINHFYVLGKDKDHLNYINTYNTDGPEDVSRKFVSTFFALQNEIKWNIPSCIGKDELLEFVRVKMLQLEVEIPPCFMHRLWGINKQKWIKTVNESRDYKQLSAGLSTLHRNIRPVLFTDSWTCTSGLMRLQCEEMKKNHNVISAMDGEHGMSNWCWVGTCKSHRYRPCSEIGLRVLGKEIEEITQRGKHYYGYFNQKDENSVESLIFIELERANSNYNFYSQFGISTGIEEHIIYPHWSTNTCQLDGLVSQRIEEVKNLRFQLIRQLKMSSPFDIPHSEFSDSNIDKNFNSFKTFMMSKGMDSNFGFVMSRSTIVKIENDGGPQNQLMDEESEIMSYWFPDTCDSTCLKAGKKHSEPIYSGHPFVSLNNKRNVFNLLFNQQKSLVRRGGLVHVPVGFLYDGNEDDCVFWPSTFAKPTFERVWSYHTLYSSSLSQFTVQLRKLNLCLRLHELVPTFSSSKGGFIDDHLEEILDMKDIDDLNRSLLIKRTTKDAHRGDSTAESSQTEWISDRSNVPIWMIKSFCESREFPRTPREPLIAVQSMSSDGMDSISDLKYEDREIKLEDDKLKKLEHSSDSKEPQKIKVFKNHDGTTYVKGLKPGQRLVQMSDGRFQLISSNPDNCAPAYSGTSARRVEKICFPENPDQLGSFMSDTKEDFSQSSIFENNQVKSRIIQPKRDAPGAVDQKIIYTIRAFIHDKSNICSINNIRDLYSLYPDKVTKHLEENGLDTSVIFMAENIPKIGVEDKNLLNICTSVMNNMLDRVERYSRFPRKKAQTRATDNRPRSKPFHQKILNQLDKQKQILKKEIMRKRTSTEQSIRREVQNEVKKVLEMTKGLEKDTNNCNLNKSPIPGVRSPSFRQMFDSFTVPRSRQDTEKLSPKDLMSSRYNRGNIPMDDKMLYCICRTPYDNNRFYIGCDVCKNWFHGSCVNLHEEEADKLESYICDSCKRSMADTTQSPVKSVSSKQFNFDLSAKSCSVCDRKCNREDSIICRQCHDYCHRLCLPFSAKPQSFKNYVCVKCAPHVHKESDVTPNDEVDRKLYCICRTAYDKTRFYIGCDSCGNWFHGSCVGLTEQEVERIDSYICDGCTVKQTNSSFYDGKQVKSSKNSKKRKKPAKKSRTAAKIVDEDVSCICRRPYDSREYIGCDRCDDWLHFDCIGISRLDANRLKRYICPRCRAQSQDESNGSPHQTMLSVRQNQNILAQFIGDLKKHKMAWPFVESVNLSEYPDYCEIISEPIDFDIIGKNAMMGRYKYIDSFMADLMKIFTNCRMYHQPESEIYRCGAVMESTVVNRIKNVIKKLDNSL